MRFGWSAVAVLLAASGAGAEVTIEKDIPYLGPDRQEKLDLYRPADAPKPGERRPGIVIIHGGGWTGGDKGAKREINIGTTLAAHGYVCVSINYALASKGHPTWPTNLQDCKRAVRWLRKNADQYSIDPDHIGAIGGSAGGHLTAMLAVTGPEEGLEPAEDPGYSSRVQAVVPMYPGSASSINRDHVMFPGTRAEVPEMYRAATPTSHVTKDDAPMLILHGTADPLVPTSQSQGLADKLNEVGVDNILVIIGGRRTASTSSPSSSTCGRWWSASSTRTSSSACEARQSAKLRSGELARHLAALDEPDRAAVGGLEAAVGVDARAPCRSSRRGRPG